MCSFPLVVEEGVVLVVLVVGEVRPAGSVQPREVVLEQAELCSDAS